MRVVARLHHSLLIRAFGRWYDLAQTCLRIRKGITRLKIRIGHGLAVRAFVTWLDAADTYRAERVAADHAARYLAMCMDVDQDPDEDENGDVTAVLDAASGFLDHCASQAVKSPDSVLSGVRDLSPAGPTTLSPPSSSVKEFEAYCKPLLNPSTKRHVVRPLHTAQTSSRRVAIDHAVGANALAEASHIMCLAKARTGGFGIYVSDSLQITSCAAQSPAGKAGLLVGQKIVKVNGSSVHSRGELRQTLQGVKSGETVAFTVLARTSYAARREPPSP